MSSVSGSALRRMTESLPMNELRELFRYGTWANIALVVHCAALPPDALQTSTEGTFGPVQDTYVHMLEQERWGLRVLKRRVPSFKESSWSSIRSTFIRHGELWQDVFDNFDELNSIPLPPSDEWESPIPEFPLMYALQTAHHQELHRTQVRSILGKTGHLPEEQDSTDVWAYWKGR
jgi:uncharacterized damage-inducible protein DinB